VTRLVGFSLGGSLCAWSVAVAVSPRARAGRRRVIGRDGAGPVALRGRPGQRPRCAKPAARPIATGDNRDWTGAPFARM